MAGPLEPYDLDFSPYSLPPDFVRAIGLVTAATGQTESTLEQLIAALLSVPDFQYGLVATTHMSMPQRFSVIRAAAEIKLDDLDALDELDDLIDQAEKAFEQRNSAVHHQWCIEPKTGRVFLVKQSARRRLESDIVQMTVKETERIALQMYDVSLALWLFMRMHGLMPPIPPNPTSRHHKSRAERKKRRETLLRAKGSGSSPK